MDSSKFPTEGLEAPWTVSHLIVILLFGLVNMTAGTVTSVEAIAGTGMFVNGVLSKVHCKHIKCAALLLVASAVRGVMFNLAGVLACYLLATTPAVLHSAAVVLIMLFLTLKQNVSIRWEIWITVVGVATKSCTCCQFWFPNLLQHRIEPLLFLCVSDDRQSPVCIL